MSWNDRDKDSESINVNSIFKHRFPRYRSRGTFNSLLDTYLMPSGKKISSGYRTRRFRSLLLKVPIMNRIVP